jgi:hypothetical protein
MSTVKFLSEQLRLLISKQIRYSTDLLLLACTFLFTFPTAYKFLREQNIVQLPNSFYLKTFNLYNVNGEINECLKYYLTQNANTIENHEKKVCLLLNEIYVKPKIIYTGNQWRVVTFLAGWADILMLLIF